MTAPAKLHPTVRAEIGRRLNDGASVYRVSKDLELHIAVVRAVRDDLGIPAGQQGNHRLAVPEPVRWDDTDEEDGDPKDAEPRRYPVGQWCVERPNQAKWLEMCDKASDVESVVLRDAMCRVLGLRLSATTPEIYAALASERRFADELAALYIQVRGRGW